MTVEQRFNGLVKYVIRQWGHGWPRIGEGLQQQLVRAEVLAEISRLDGMGTDPVAYRNLVEALSDLAMQWEPTQ